VGNAPHPRRDGNNVSADRFAAFHVQTYFMPRSRRKENACRNVFGCGRSEPGIDFLATSGFNDVSRTGILTYLRKQAGRKCQK
jgi:hypothetical protein